MYIVIRRTISTLPEVAAIVGASQIGEAWLAVFSEPEKPPSVSRFSSPMEIDGTCIFINHADWLRAEVTPYRRPRREAKRTGGPPVSMKVTVAESVAQASFGSLCVEIDIDRLCRNTLISSKLIYIALSPAEPARV